jgi:hypothetical protein
MVEDRVTDGERIAQLLASELSGRSDGALFRLSVVDADRDAESSPDGTVAYGVAVDGERVGDVRLYPGRAELYLGTSSASLDVVGVVEAVRGPGLAAELAADGGAVVTIEFGAAVKRAADALVTGLD